MRQEVTPLLFLTPHQRGREQKQTASHSSVHSSSKSEKVESYFERETPQFRAPLGHHQKPHQFSSQIQPKTQQNQLKIKQKPQPTF